MQFCIVVSGKMKLRTNRTSLDLNRNSTNKKNDNDRVLPSIMIKHHKNAHNPINIKKKRCEKFLCF